MGCSFWLSYDKFSQEIHKKALSNHIPIDGTFELTQYCNLKCLHCYCSPEKGKKELDFSQICNIFDQLKNAGCLWLLITGGEPLSRDDFLDTYLYAKKCGFFISLFTNATLINQKIIDCLKIHLPFIVEVSLYGASPKTYEQITGVSGSFDKCIEGISLLKKNKIPFRLKTTLTTINLNELDKIKKVSKEFDVEFRFDYLIHPKINGKKHPCDLRLKPLDAVMLDVSDNARFNAWQDLFKRLGLSSSSDQLFTCFGGKTAFHIDPYGILRICDMVRGISHNILEGDFFSGWENIYNQTYLKGYKCSDKCRSCDISNICDQCPGWSYLENGNLNTPVDYLCEIAHIRKEKLVVK